MAYFITGGTGFVGTEVTAALLRTSEETIYVLVRAADEETAIHRLRSGWQDLPELRDEIGKRIKPVAGDFMRADLALSQEQIQNLRGCITQIFHIGAETGIQKSREELLAVNRDGTSYMLDFAHAVSRDGSLKRFLYVSTAYTAGLRSGRIMENDPLPDEYATFYEESKALAEKLVMQSGLPYTIARPGMIVGNSVTGRITKFNTIYYVLKLILQEKLPVLPVSAGQKLNIVPVDYVADSIVKLASHPEAEKACFHLTSPQESQPSAGEMMAFVRRWAKENLLLDLSGPVFIPLPMLKKAGLRHNLRTDEKEKNPLSNLTALMVYFYDEHIFDRSETDRLLGRYQPDWRNYAGPMLRYACRYNFLHHSERSVFEQVLFRLKSKTAPISYYDVGENEIAQTTADEMRRKIRLIRSGLRRLGVKKGDRVALTGINSTEYFGLNIAIGLSGAVAVPIYYTTPVEEIDILLEKSGAGWFFVGDRRIMKQITTAIRTVPVIAFSDALKAGEECTAVMTWDTFLKGGKEPLSGLAPEAEKENRAGSTAVCSTETEKKDRAGSTAVCSTETEKKDRAGSTAGRSQEAEKKDGKDQNGRSLAVRIDPEDLAAIHYTSGTTGDPKGVMFHAGQLSWMGQVMTDLISWKDKQEEMRYLSFLPLSHVVEGILASYAPYYMHCPVKYYYLNDFSRLTTALLKVRPTVFFSVPRFYEKLWQQIEENPVGRKYLKAGKGPYRSALGKILRKAVLKKAGLDHCSTLIVGSAPISEELLLKFRELGIEIYNAYGQTEAPLITINRPGDNVIGSIGTPLPDTRVTLLEDGELIVEGPQVCKGYYGLETDTIRGSILKSGDLGSIDEGGHIYLIGRKKEMVVTSYGKNINCPKIEERLKNIPGISEAVLIGERRPYCTALLWPAENADLSGLKEQIEKMNEKLSHPETIRKWTLIDQPLTIPNGELTPNLKVRRNVVQEHFRDVIEKMYET